MFNDILETESIVVIECGGSDWKQWTQSSLFEKSWLVALSLSPDTASWTKEQSELSGEHLPSQEADQTISEKSAVTRSGPGPVWPFLWLVTVTPTSPTTTTSSRSGHGRPRGQYRQQAELSALCLSAREYPPVSKCGAGELKAVAPGG